MNVYDFDNTIYDGESCLDFFWYYINKYPKLIKLTPRVIHAFAKYKRGKVTVEQALEQYAPEVEDFFRSIPDFDADCRDFWDKHIKNIKPFYAEIQKEDDLIISASPELSIKEICDRIGIKHYLGSKVDRETGKITELCMRSHKIEIFKREYPDAVIDAFYTDSVKNDAPLIALAETAYEVKGNKVRRIK